MILSWYRPPEEPFETFDKLEQVLRFSETEVKEIILLGDTNYDFSTKTGGTNQLNPRFHDTLNVLRTYINLSD